MTKKTRIRVARIAAGAVIAAGASLTAAGAASALEIGVSAQAGEEGVGLGVTADLDDEDSTGGPTPPETPPTTIPEEPPTTIPEEPPTTTPEEPTGKPTAPEEPTEPEPTEPNEPTEPEEPIEDPTTPGNGGGNGGGNAADPDGGASPQEQGSSALTDTGDEAPAPSTQGDGKELAETGAMETTFLVIGAATMIAGGIGFRVLPRLMAGRGAAA
ncbi:hypothetical protein [Streptomyces griseomycini]|uniref:Outer membrane biosynthesis protein TonB n=1 Tax=Streptomyces griseomycini TaxID=66895 RepID=A0A7W7PTT8_9ACTN|nr:hypothetical protein [Streptomyces griseomycini]MBB4901173.1 outer membrane biosynthesis protein TonB [Streptomyces griseomycini]GGR17455.1 hypothetical protein GCM10015536_23940 [Streptomyces griseomycini]